MDSEKNIRLQADNPRLQWGGMSSVYDARVKRTFSIYYSHPTVTAFWSLAELLDAT